jgi:hypothetical protein
MKRQPDQSQPHDRRTFVKSVTSALATAPLALAAAEGQERRTPRTEPCCCQPISTEGPFMAGACPHPILFEASETHEPPVIITGGSLQMECEVKMKREGGIAPQSNSPRRHLYEFDLYLYGEMHRLQVVTQYQNVFTTECYDMQKAGVRFPSLKIWLQRREEDGWNSDDIAPGKTDAHIFFRYEENADTEFARDSDFQALVLEVDKKFDSPKKGFRDSVTYKHGHKGYGHNKHFRIGRWMLLDGGGRLLVGNSVGRRDLSDETKADVFGFSLVPHFLHLEDAVRRARAMRRATAPHP